MNKVMFISCTLLFLAGCAIGSPKFVKINKNGSFLLTQKYNKDILCVESENKNNGMRCYYVSDSKKD